MPIAADGGLLRARQLDLNSISHHPLSVEGMAGHASYLLMILSMLMTGDGVACLGRSFQPAQRQLPGADRRVPRGRSFLWQSMWTSTHRRAAATTSPTLRRGTPPLVEPAQAQLLLDPGQWCERHVLRQLMAQALEIEHVIDWCLHMDMRLKLAAANQAMADADIRLEVVHRPACNSWQDAAARRCGSAVLTGAVRRAVKAWKCQRLP